MGRVDVALQGLHPVALLQHHEGRIDLLGGQRTDLEGGKRRRCLPRAHVGPDHAVDVAAGIRAGAHLVLEGAFLRLVGHVDAAARDVPLPAVIRAAEPALLVAAEEERGAAVGAVGGQEPHPSLRVAEGHEVLAEQAHPFRRAVGHGQFRGGQAGHPVVAQQLAHGRAASDPAQQLVVFAREHRLSPCSTTARPRTPSPRRSPPPIDRRGHSPRAASAGARGRPRP